MKAIRRSAALSVGLLVLGLLPQVWAQQNNVAPGDKEAQVLDFEDLVYPPLARTARIEGSLVVQVKLDENGKVIDAEAISGRYLLADPSVRNVKKWQFKPNTTKTAVVVYQFSILKGRCKSAASVFSLQGADEATIVTCDRVP